MIKLNLKLTFFVYLTWKSIDEVNCKQQYIIDILWVQ